MLHPADAKARNPRIQCDSCGKWSRIHLADGKQFSYGGCEMNGGNDHSAAADSQDIYYECCRTKCKGDKA